MKEIKIIKTKEKLNIKSLKKGVIHRLYIHLSDSSLGVPWRVPITIIKGLHQGPTVGLTAAVHGNELNGIYTIFKLIDEVDPAQLHGTLVLVPISNVPGYLMNQREFSDGVDLNRIIPGKIGGTSSELYAHYFIDKIVSKFDYLLDLHTASPGRVNSLYIRADLDNDDCRTLAYLQHPQIIVKKGDGEGNLRAWANENNIPAITIEIGNPNSFQHVLIDETLDGILNTLKYLKMIEGTVRDLIGETVICDKSYWIYSHQGGIVDVLPNLADTIKKGDLIARIYDAFGHLKSEICADDAGIVIGKNVSPHCSAGARILHLGINEIEPMPDTLPSDHSELLS